MKTIKSVTKMFDTTYGSEYSVTEQGYNLLVVKSKINYLSDVLKNRGILFLNDAYLEMGFPLTREGQKLGWFDDKIGFRVNYGTIVHSNMIEVTFTNLRNVMNKLPREEEL